MIQTIPLLIFHFCHLFWLVLPLLFFLKTCARYLYSLTGFLINPVSICLSNCILI
uniref:Uncharacterized protein n=1 Tax=Arundo donax TaxID=35708 RepID=A0A0A9D963_ARUDO